MEKVIIGLSGVFLGAILTTMRDFWKYHRTRKKRAEYLAIRVSCTLDRFINDCVKIVGDDGMMYGPDEHGCAQLQTSYPEIDFQLLDVDWKSLPFNLMYEILNFPSYIEEANGLIENTFEYIAGPPDYNEGIEERRFQYAKLGLIAEGLSTKLRVQYNMPKKIYENWNPVEYLEENKTKFEKRKNKE